MSNAYAGVQKPDFVFTWTDAIDRWRGNDRLRLRFLLPDGSI